MLLGGHMTRPINYDVSRVIIAIPVLRALTAAWCLRPCAICNTASGSQLSLSRPTRISKFLNFVI